ncbi:ubiquitin carboxyl-terminal hydrolase 48-like isoform X2 [Oryzias melastigma]|uniref:ubiquitin carboxyl-terminal hydrolase 48-like isoform X2 n=1 Tax=Oryzias melastigma TaxID=30732 RepID=UPI00168D3D25|nr:ubiquitin carboxyl-terminal hydrolase 48-like isoform X2 [Oryzias melastigma]
MSSSKNQQYTGVPYKGLLNQGSTCYLNSVLQVLFMTPDFREALQRSPPGSLDSHLKELFDELKNYDCNTYKITKALGITDVHVQADAAECFENILRNITNPEASQIFQGVLRVKNKCSKCDTETCDDNPCWSLPLELVDSEAEYRVEDGITQYFHPSEVSGPDQLFCEDCDAKTDSTVKLELKQHPEVLMLLLKRFKFDYYYMHYYKVEHRVELPLILEIQNQTYELYAFVEHHGYLKYGNYTANIKSPEDMEWYHFNDDRVNLYYQFFQLDKIETSRSAYLLFYRKISAEEALIEESKKECTPESTETLRGETNEPKECNEETVDSQRSHEIVQSCDSEERQETEESLQKKITSVEKEEELKDQMMKSLRKEEENFREQKMMNLRKEEENLKDQMRMNLRKDEENLKDQMRMNLKKEEENFRDQMRMNLRKEEDQIRMNLKKEEENFRDQMRMNLRKEEGNLKDQMRMNLKKEEENFRDQTRMNLRKEEDQMRMNLRKEEDQMRMNLRKEEGNLKDQIRMNLRKEEENLKDQMRMNLRKEEENLKDQMRMNLSQLD